MGLKEEYRVKTRDEIIAKAISLGLEVFWPMSDEICLDMDQNEVNPNFQENIRVISCLIENDILVYASRFVTTSAGGKNQHIYFKLNKSWSEKDKLIMQACLGSDPLKEVLNILGEPLAMFETPAEAKRVVEWRAKYVNTNTDATEPF